MSGTLSLNGTWGLTWAEGSELMRPDYYMAPTLVGRKLLPAPVPAPIHKVLMDQGLLEDPNLGLGSLRARWVEEMYWVYRHTFEVPAEAAEQAAWLVFERLEYLAEVHLNGEKLGEHANALRPARFEVTGKLKPGENLLVVRVSAGLHEHSDLPAREYAASTLALLTKRMWMRKPQYQGGWDWNPRLTNVGILGDVRLEWASPVRLGQVTVFAVVAEDLASATVHARATVEAVGETPVDATLKARIVETGQEASVALRLEPGESRPELTLPLDQPRLWWPIGHGEQFRYTVQVTLEAAGETQTAERKLGVRRVEVDQSPHPVEGKYFTLKVNDRPIFCKGGNWTPADLLYSTMDEARFRALVDLAVEANFTMLRVWGGGPYADHAFLEACDERGILVWHDFGFACAKWPADVPAFAQEVRREITWVVRELAHHPSLVVWCGNNEVEWGDWHWGYDEAPRTHPHYFLFHHDLPQIVQAEDPPKFYWPSSPFSPDYAAPNDPTVGDQHPWSVSIELPGGADWWRYRGYVDRFPNEGGIMGSALISTLRDFLPEGERHLLSPSWDHHDNPTGACHDHEPGTPGHGYKTVTLWLGRDPFAMEMAEYAFVSGLLQAEGLTEYVSNYRRRMYSSASAIFWMYNDSWPSTNTWGIVDYYLRRRLSYHPVRRAYQPVSVVVAEDGDQVTVYGVNDTPGAWSGELRWGLFYLAGGYALDQTQAVTLPALASTPLASFARSQWDAAGTPATGAFALLSREGQIHAQYRLFVERFQDLQLSPDPGIRLTLIPGGLELVSEAFAWGVCLDETGDLPVPDNCFDLLPGVAYCLPWSEDLGEPRVVRLGNRDAWRG